jgi:hypothetical protein
MSPAIDDEEDDAPAAVAPAAPAQPPAQVSLTVNGRKVSVDSSFLKLSPAEQNATVDEIAKSLPATKAPEPAAPSGIFAGIKQGASDLIHGVGETAKQFAGADNSRVEGAAKAVAPNNYVPAQVVPEGGHWYDPRTYNYSQIPQAVAEAAPGMATDIAAARLGAKVHPLVGLGAGLASYLMRTRGDAAKTDAAIRTGTPDAPVETQDKVRSLATGVVEGLPVGLGISRFLPGVAGSALSKVAKTAAVEGGSGAARNAISQAGATVGTDQGLTVDPAKVVDAGITSAATGGAIALPKGIAEAHVNKKLAPLGGDNEDATKALVARVQQAADGKNLANTGEAYNSLKTATGAVKDELKAAVKPIKGTLDNDTRDALKRAASASDTPLTEADLSNIEQNTSPDIAFLARQAHVSSLVKGLGDFGGDKFVGGITNAFGKHIRAYSNPVGYGTATALGALGGHAGAAALMPYSLPTAAALATGYLGMRGIDSFTGNRSPLDNVVKRFSDPNAQVRLPAPAAAPAPAPSTMPPTGPKVPFNPGVAGGGTALALGQNPFAPKPPAPEPAPQINPLALPKDITGPAKNLMSALQRVQAMQASAAQPAPAPEAPIDPLALPKSLLAKSKVITEGLANVAKMRDTTLGNQSVDRIARQSPMVDAAGGLDAIRNPAVGKRASQLVSASRAIQQLLRQPEEEGQGPVTSAPTLAPQAPEPAPVQENPATSPAASVDPGLPGMLAQAAATILKKNGKVTLGAPVDHVERLKAQARQAELSPEYTGDYVPLKDHELFGQHLNDAAFAARAAQEPNVKDPKAYAEGVVRDRQKRRNVLADLTGDAPIEDQEQAAQLLQQLHHIRRGATAAKAIKHYTEKMSPETRDAIRKRMDASFINSMWSS